MSHDDFAFEPIPGLPAELPEGETILWQGSPRWQGLAAHALHAKPAALYCAILLGWVTYSAMTTGGGALALLSSLALPLTLVALLFAIIAGLAYGFARSTIYTITNRRVVMRFGIALPITINLPFGKIETAALKRNTDGTGDIPLALKGNDRLAWLQLWPHARPWRFSKPEPMMRNLADVDQVATLLADALAAALPEGEKTLPATGRTQAPIADRRPAGDLATA